MKTVEEWTKKFYLLNSPNAKMDILVKLFRDIQSDALNHAAQVIHDLSRGTRSEERAMAIDEARDLILDEVRYLESK